MTKFRVFLVINAIVLGSMVLFIFNDIGVSQNFEDEGEITLPVISLSLSGLVQSRETVILEDASKGLRLQFSVPYTQTNFFREFCNSTGKPAVFRIAYQKNLFGSAVNPALRLITPGSISCPK